MNREQREEERRRQEQEGSSGFSPPDLPVVDDDEDEESESDDGVVNVPDPFATSDENEPTEEPTEEPNIAEGMDEEPQLQEEPRVPFMFPENHDPDDPEDYPDDGSWDDFSHPMSGKSNQPPQRTENKFGAMIPKEQEKRKYAPLMTDYLLTDKDPSLLPQYDMDSVIEDFDAFEAMTEEEKANIRRMASQAHQDHLENEERIKQRWIAELTQGLHNHQTVQKPSHALSSFSSKKDR